MGRFVIRPFYRPALLHPQPEKAGRRRLCRLHIKLQSLSRISRWECQPSLVLPHGEKRCVMLSPQHKASKI
ncbi:hypothetical protein RRG08_056825 [Elysia crispata]|uniref:Uncharacterized protein n=1 Tax=Elysia crispata TaxID=231223 RepID=A0AAE1AC92_9GAST|nr:hypothetical protein RRG08_056825 [Elysia crispata]